MKAARIHEHGGSDVIHIDEISKPEPGNGEVQVQLKSAALNHLDIWVRKGLPGVPLPMILGSDGSGVVSAVGENVNRLKVGNEVIIQPLVYCGECRYCQAGKENYCNSRGIRGESTDGTNCEYMVLDEKFVEYKPENISFDEAAAFPLTAQTAFQMLIKQAQIKPGENVLIWGAGSGVGNMAVQIAKSKSCTVIATAGTDEKCDFAKELDPDLVINHYKDNVVSQIKEFCSSIDVVFEHVGSATWETSMKVLNKAGRIVTCGATTGSKIAIDLRHLFFKQQTVMGSTMGDADTFAQVIKLVEAEKIKPRVDKTFTLSEIQLAHEYLEKSKQFGKVIVKI